MKIVIQCASKKTPGAGCLTTGDGRRVSFIAHPEVAPSDRDKIYARPDDLASDGKTWREILLAYNELENNPCNLLPAYKLYGNPVYGKLVERYGESNVFILSAGWGLVNAAFLTPAYDITFSHVSGKNAYKRRGKRDNYDDLTILPPEADDDLFFFGGKNYQQPFCHLTKNYRGKRFGFYNSAVAPDMPGCELIKYRTRRRTNWHYQCAKDFIAGKIPLRGH